MVVTELGTPTEIKTKNELLTLDLLRLLSTPRFFGGRLGGKNTFTEEMSAYRQYCQEIGTAVVSSVDIDYPINFPIPSSRAKIYGLAVPEGFADSLRAEPETQTGLLVVAAVTQRNKIMAVNNQWTEDRYNLVAECHDYFRHKAGWISNHWFGFGDFLNKHLEIKLL